MLKKPLDKCSGVGYNNGVMEDNGKDIFEGLGKFFRAVGVFGQLHKIEDIAVIYNIHYCTAGVGFCFYEPPEDFEIDTKYPSDEWRKYLITYSYYPTFEEAVEGEYKRLGLDK